jgi:exonuclease III
MAMPNNHFQPNSDAERNAPTYELLTMAGFADSWKQAHPRSYGFTCCQSGDLTGEGPAFYQRIDLILYRGELQPRLVMLVGEDKVVPLEAGTIWPSDHAGLCAVLEH